MEIVIRNTSPLPIYEQITRQVKGLILSGDLSEGEALPSIRALAKDLHISVITTRRAYDDLERDGYIVTVPGKGCFVRAPSQQARRETFLRQAEEYLGKAIDAARIGGITLEELQEMLQVLYGTE